MEDRIGNTCVEYEEDFLKDFPTAMEMRERKNSLTVKDKLALNEIAKLLNDAHDRTLVTYEGCLSSAVKRFLCGKGYKIDTDRQYNTDYMIISWRK